ncbi:MAG: helicase C-terminal domain-containing protein [Candidatus Odinarchaeota archaeon]
MVATIQGKTSDSNKNKQLLDTLASETYRIFPFDSFKQDQGSLILKVLNEDRLIVQAPTGFGKTAVMFSTLLPFVTVLGARLVLVTRTKMQIFKVFLRELRKLVLNISDRKLQYRYKQLHIVPLIGKTSMCTARDVPRGLTSHVCSAVPCAKYKQTKNFDHTAVQGILDALDYTADFKNLNEYRNILQEQGCPYYMAWRMVFSADIILATHAYLRNPDLLSLLLHAIDRANEQQPRPTFLLVDEAHDFGPVKLAGITAGELKFLSQEFPYDMMVELLDTVLSKTGLVDLSNVSSLDVEILKSAMGTFQTNAKKIREKVAREAFLKNARMINTFIEFIQANGDYWGVIPPPELDTGLSGVEKKEHLEPDEILVLEEKRELVSLQPFPDKIFASLEGFDKVILMSGTFKPLDLYARYYGLNNGPRPYKRWLTAGRVGARFEAVLVNRRFSSSFKNRDTQLYERYAEAIKVLHSINPNHTIVFCPSYAFKDGITEFIRTKYEEKSKLGGFDWLEDLPYMNHELVLATAGGKLVEGIEILQGGSGRSLITLVIYAGLPYPPPDYLSREVLSKLYTKKWNKESAKQFLTDLPLLRNIQQGFGRGIRNPDDFSAAVILDWRGQYLNVFDRYVKTPDLQRLVGKLEEFYGKNS